MILKAQLKKLVVADLSAELREFCEAVCVAFDEQQNEIDRIKRKQQRMSERLTRNESE